MTVFCAFDGCIHQLHAKNLSAVCRLHLHTDACRCARCRAQRKITAGRLRRTVTRFKFKTRAELIAERLLPGLEAMPAPIPPHLKGTR